MNNTITIFGNNIMVGRVNNTTFIALDGVMDNVIIFDENDIGAIDNFIYANKSSNVVGMFVEYDYDIDGRKFPITVLKLKGKIFNIENEDANAIYDAISYLSDLINGIE